MNHGALYPALLRREQRRDGFSFDGHFRYKRPRAETRAVGRQDAEKTRQCRPYDKITVTAGSTEMAHRIKWDERGGPAVNARRHLPTLVSEYFAYVRDLLRKKPTPSKLHGLRLSTKRLRYTLELFRPCYGPGLELRIEELRRMQQLLGEMNDGAATRRLLSKAMKHSAQWERTQKFLKERTDNNAAEFQKQWTKVFDAPGRERWWTGYLAREARPPARPANVTRRPRGRRGTP